MVKQPRPGRVKTRLGRDIGMVDATWWYRWRLRRLIRDLADPRWRLILAVAPDPGALRARDWAHPHRVGQGGGDLGHRMGRLLRHGPPGPALLIGSDIPGVRRAHIARAFRALGRAEVVLGPAPDGGFWLIGARRMRPFQGADAFRGARWSSEHALGDVMANLGDRRLALTDTLQDVDRAADLPGPQPPIIRS